MVRGTQLCLLRPRLRIRVRSVKGGRTLSLLASPSGPTLVGGPNPESKADAVESVF